MNNKTIFLTEEQLKRVYEAALKESLVVNCDFVKMVVKFLDAHFRPVKYDDINADGDVIQPYAIQVLSMDKEPLQTISTDKLIGKLDNKFAHKIKDEKDRHKFFKQVIDDWIHKRISPEGILSVNMIKENKYSLNENQTSKPFDSAKRFHIQRTGKTKETLLLLNESATDRFIEKLIFNKLPEQLKPYTDTAIGTLLEQHPDLVDQQSLGITDGDLVKYRDYPLKDFIRLSISKMFDIGRGRGPKKYLRGIFRIVLDELDYLRHPDTNAILSLKDDVMYIMQAAQNNTDQEAVQMDSNLNGLSAQQLHSKFKEKRKAFFKGLRDKVGSMFKGNAAGGSEYKVVPILRHEDAEKYAPYTSWCITYSNPSNYDQYTQGGRRFYIFLRNGFENVEAVRGENCPMDEYGLSMVSVLVNMEGDIDIITTRWNHDNEGEFSHPDEKTIMMFQNAIGMDLYGVCKPYTKEELRAMGLKNLEMAMEELANGADPKDVFVKVGDFYDGCAAVKLNRKWNFINRNGELIGNQWYDYAWYFREEYAQVKLGGKGYNFINRNGEVIGNQWYDDAGFFNEGYAEVNLGGNWYELRKDGVLCDYDTKQPIEGGDRLEEAIDRVIKRLL